VNAAAPPWTLLALSPLPDALLEDLVGPLGTAIRLTRPRGQSRAALLEALRDAELILSDWSGVHVLDSEAVVTAERLSFVQQPVAGVDGHDLAAMAAAGIPLANAAGTNSPAVAEWCLAATLAMLRELVITDAQLRAGGWPQLALRGSELAGLRIGVVGFGPVGQACARLFGAVGCEVVYWSRRRRPPGEEHGAAHRPLADLLAGSDVLVVVVALTEETRGIIDAARLRLLPHGSYLVNAARGAVVDQGALLAALDSGRLAGAALDVFDPEPPAHDHPLRRHPGILLSPHVAGASKQTWTRVVRLVTGNLAAAVRGEPVRNVVNDVAPVLRRRS
jgi:phosphoglycerate dehydrogenase-like enzyme